MLKPYDYQIDISNRAYTILKANGLVFLAMEERTGKTLTSLLICSLCNNVQKVLIVTKKKALDGWKDTLARFGNEKAINFVLTNYEALHKLQDRDFSLAIIDEAHYAISSYPKPSKTFLQLRAITFNLPCIFLSATPSAESFSQLFHELQITKYSPFARYRNFYEWYREYGIPNAQWVSGRRIERYNTTKVDEVVKAVNHLFIAFSRNDLGFKQEPLDKPVYIEPSPITKQLVCSLKASKILEVSGHQYVADTISKELVALHQIEGGTLKIDESLAVVTGATEKIDYILREHGDHDSLVVMYNYVAEQALLKQYFKKALILQATAFAEGVDLSKYSKLVIYSMNFSASKFIQRRARQCNLERDEPIIVEHLLCKGFISEAAYDAIVNNKMSFTAHYYAKNKEKFENSVS